MHIIGCATCVFRTRLDKPLCKFTEIVKFANVLHSCKLCHISTTSLFFTAGAVTAGRARHEMSSASKDALAEPSALGHLGQNLGNFWSKHSLNQSRLRMRSRLREIHEIGIAWLADRRRRRFETRNPQGPPVGPAESAKFRKNP